MLRSGCRPWFVTHRRLLAAVGVLTLVSALATTRAATPAFAAGPCGPPVTSVIACENTLPGDPESDWQIANSGDASLQGYATAMSVNVGDTVTFKIKSTASAYHLDILRVGYYQGNGARKIVSKLAPTVPYPQSQPACLTDSTTGLIDCGNWSPSASWTVPSTAVSGLYLVHLVRNDNGAGSLVPFVVRNDASHSDLIFQTSDTTWQAYNTYGGNSLYSCTVACPPGNPHPYKGALKVSYNRPFHTADDDQGRDWFLYTEYPMIRFLEANGYDVSYMGGLDVDTRGSLLTNHKVFLSVGHDEYWSGGQRANVEAARAAGVNLAFFSGNEVFWKTRWEPSADGSNTPGRTLVTYKETHFDAPADPQDPPTWTGTWEDPRFSPPADGGRPQNALTGQLFEVNSGTTDIQVPAKYAALRLWRNTPVASLTGSQVATLGAGTGTLGYEWDADVDDGFRPAGLFDMSSTTLNTAEVFTDYGSSTAIGPKTHHLTLYRAPGGALVFGAGTVQWSWGLDDGNPNGRAPDKTMQQATVNLFADMGAQPATLTSGLVAASASTDTTSPSSTITSPTGASSVTDGSTVTVAGTASDAGGGVVAGVEVSTDGGATWHPATGTTTWSYTWVAHGAPSTVVKSRAVDDSGNLETPGNGVGVTVTCPCSIWGTGAAAGPDSGDTQSIEVGVKFTSDTFGTVNGLRFYKVTGNTGTHVGSLWSATGQRLATATFTGETSSGWQQVLFSSPVPITPNTTYVASYLAPSGHYAQTAGYFYPPPAPAPDGGGVVDSAPLHALRNVGSTTNGVYVYTSSSAFPTLTFNAENYWVDPLFTPSPAPGQVTGVTATPQYSAAAVAWTAPSSSTATSYVVTPYVGGVAKPVTTVSGLPAPTSALVTGLTNGTTYTFTVTASNPNGTGPESAPSAPITPSANSSAVVNGGFESGSQYWSTGGEITPSVSTAQKHNGSNAALLGALSGSFPAGDSWFSQPISVPAAQPTLSFWYYTGSADALCSGTGCVWDWVEAQVRSTSGTTLTSVMKLNSNSKAWTQVTFDMSAYAGQTVALWFNVHQDSSSPPDDTYMYVDDVTVAGNTPTVPAAPTGVSAVAGNTSASVSWTAPSNGGSTITSYTITPSIGSTAQTPTTVTGNPPATTATITGLTNGTSLYLHRHRDQRGGYRTRLGTVECGDPVGADSAGCAQRCDRTCAERLGNVVVDGAVQRGVDNHLLHDHPLHRVDRADSHHGHRQPTGHHCDDHRADQRHELYLHRHRNQRHRHRTGLHPVQRGHSHRGRQPRLRATDLRASDRDLVNPDSDIEHHVGEPADRPGRGVELGQRHHQLGHRQRRQHLDQADLGHRRRPHRAQHLVRTHHRGWWDQAHHHRDPHRDRRHWRRRAGVRRAVHRLRGRSPRRLQDRHRHHQRRRHGGLRGYPGDHRRTRAGHRLLRRLRLRRHPHPRHRLDRAGQRLPHRRHGAPHRGPDRQRRRNPQRHHRHRPQHPLVSRRPRAQVSLGRPDRPRRPDRGVGGGRKHLRVGVVDGAVQRGVDNHLLHDHPLHRVDRADSHHGHRQPTGHHCDDHRADQRHEPTPSPSPRPTPSAPGRPPHRATRSPRPQRRPGNGDHS